MAVNVKRVSGNSILQHAKDAGATIKNYKPMGGLQKAGYRLAVGVGLAIIVVIIGLGFVWANHAPPPPTLPEGPVGITDVEMANMTTLLEHYRTANDMALEGPMKLFDQVVAKALLPLFTLILGYIFGSRTQEQQSGDDG